MKKLAELKNVSIICAVLALSTGPIVAQQPLDLPLKNWPAPLYWSPHTEERAIRQAGQSSATVKQAESAFSSPGAMTFFAMTPCRVMDTRASYGFTGAFGPPSLSAASARDIPMLSSPCNSGIPATVGAYSLNVTVVPPGPLGYLTLWPEGLSWPGTATLNDLPGVIIANAAIVPAGTNGDIQILASNPTDVIIDINRYYAVPTDSSSNTSVGAGALASDTTGQHNTAVGASALTANSQGTDNTALGAFALWSNTSGMGNTATGSSALQSNTTGFYNTALGWDAMFSNTAGYYNTATGAYALQYNNSEYNSAYGAYALQANTSGNGNTAMGFYALAANTSGGSNTATGLNALVSNMSGNFSTGVGLSALFGITTGSNNIAIGYQAAANLGGNDSNNIEIGSQGSAGDKGTIRIGTGGAQTSFYVAGVNGVTTTNSAVPVLIDTTNGQLGVTSSSRRYKEDIHDMGDASRNLMRLRPVAFRYRKPFADGSKPIQYGLIAEEVADVYPDLVAHSADGQIETVKYQVLDSMLLNEAQRQEKEQQLQRTEIESLKRQNAELLDRLAKIEAVLANYSNHQ